MYVFLDGQQQLIGIDRLDEVIGDLVANRLVHDALLLALCHHHHRHIRVDLFDQRKGLQACQAGHILIQEDDVKRLLLAAVNRILSTDYSHHLVALILQKKDMRFQEVDLIIRPKYLINLYCHSLLVYLLLYCSFSL